MEEYVMEIERLWNENFNREVEKRKMVEFIKILGERVGERMGENLG